MFLTVLEESTGAVNIKRIDGVIVASKGWNDEQGKFGRGISKLNTG